MSLPPTHPLQQQHLTNPQQNDYSYDTEQEQEIMIPLFDNPAETTLSEEFLHSMKFSPLVAPALRNLSLETIADLLVYFQLNSYETGFNSFYKGMQRAHQDCLVGNTQQQGAVPPLPSPSEAQDIFDNLKTDISALILNDRIVSLSDLPMEERISTGDSILDNIIGDGFLTTKLIEISGPSSSGKSQLALQLCIQTCCPVEMGGLEGRALYCNTDAKYSSEKLKQMINAKMENLTALKDSPEVGKQLKKKLQSYSTDMLEDRIIVSSSVPSVEEFDGMLKTIDRYCSLNHDIRLVVIDSVASIYRGMEGSQESVFIERARSLCNVMRSLKRMADMHNICVVTVNQVSAVIDELSLLGQNRTKATLGLVWANSLHARISLMRKEDSKMSASREFQPAIKRRKLSHGSPNDDEDSQEEMFYVDHVASSMHRESIPKREMSIEFSSYATRNPVVCRYMIDDRGLRGLVT